MLPAGKDMGRYLALGQVGLEMVVPIGVGLAIDYWIGWGPWAVVTGTVLGFSGGLAHLIVMANKLNKKESEQDAAGPDSESQ